MPQNSFFLPVKSLEKSDNGQDQPTLIEYDCEGNPVLYVEASNENLDFDGERVLKEALLAEKEYFKENGYISWDHLARQTDNHDPQFIIGKPLDVYEKNGSVWVKMVLARSNKYVQDIIEKVKDGVHVFFASIGASSAEKRGNLITSLIWDELAITHKPVNQTMAPLSFVKAIHSDSAGFASSGVMMSGFEQGSND